ncbi:MAG: hypothetical protein AAF655_03980 [Bacteroidota bacterium]
MTREDILLNSIWTSGKMMVYSDFFRQEVQLSLFTSDFNLKNTKHIISEKFVETLNDFLNLSENSKPLIKQLLYKHCVACCENISYGFDPLEGESEMQANLREFGINNEEDAFEKISLNHVVIEENKLRNNRFVRLVFYPEWENEHGCELILRNGELLDHYGEIDTYLGQFD